MRIMTTDVIIYFIAGNGKPEIVPKVNIEEVENGVLTLRYIDDFYRETHIGSWPLAAIRKWERRKL